MRERAATTRRQQRPTEQLHGMWERARTLAPHMPSSGHLTH